MAEIASNLNLQGADLKDYFFSIETIYVLTNR
ncbi:hypothetical protein SAMN05216283_111132 [Sunxiuqinia elliptica]|uniref:Uncharacterized protein n=1 Tax=Sunxiuqinia elliptica TaxID=655355 RepID=A0A1I2KDH2_9BACT|nr:hypothetical protein SAMN05216283_111132 [Sunxiuqinia elliptica]